MVRKVLAILFLPTVPLLAEAAELCDEGEKAEISGVIESIDPPEPDEVGEERTWLLWAKDGEQTNCLYQALMIAGDPPLACTVGATFSLTGRVGEEDIIEVEKISCGR